MLNRTSITPTMRVHLGSPGPAEKARAPCMSFTRGCLELSVPREELWQHVAARSFVQAYKSQLLSFQEFEPMVKPLVSSFSEGAFTGV